MKTVEIIFWIALFVVFYAYIGYGLLLALLVRLKEAVRKPAQAPQPDEWPDVTLLIAAYNEEDVVPEKMENCRALDYPPGKLRILWVTDGSNDGTNDRLARYPDATVCFQPQRQGKTAALNRGIGQVTTPLVVFTDANTMLNREAIREIVRPFTDPRVGCVAGEKRIAQRHDGSAAATEGVYWKYESLLKQWDSRLCSTVGAAGELYAIRRDLFVKMPPDTLLDDFILSMTIARRGYRIAYCREAFAEESESADMHEEGKRKVRICAGGLQSVWRLRPLLNIFRYGTLSFQYISHRVLRWSAAPLCLFALLPLNVALVASGRHAFLYTTLLILQILFYLGAFGGWYLARHERRNRYLFIPYYFLFMNANVIRGALYLARRRGSKSGAWEKARRSA